MLLYPRSDQPPSLRREPTYILPGRNTQSVVLSLRRFSARLLALGLLLGLMPTRAAVIVGPWLEGEMTTNVDVLVECDSAAVMTVNYGPTTDYSMSATTSVCWTNPNNGPDFVHRIKLTGLQTNTLYHYRLAGQGALAADYEFATMPPTNLIASVTLSEVPAAVSNAVAGVADGRAVKNINQVNHSDGPQFYTYIADPLGPELLTVSTNGTVLLNARVVPFADLPQAIQDAARRAVAGRLQVCRQASQTGPPFVVANSQSPYVIDYILNEEEPVFVLMRETDGWVRACYGYYEGDPD
jgi:hypothetical protein